MTAATGLRILAFCDYFSEHSSGGSERAALEIYQRLARQGASIRVITPMPASMPAVAGSERLEVQAVPSLDLTQRLGIQAALAPSLFRVVRASAAEFRPNVLHANTLFFSSTLAAARLQRATGLPLVTTAQIAGLDLLPVGARLAGMAYERTFGRFILSRSSRVIAVSPSVRAHLQKLGTPEGRIAVIPNGVDLERFHPGAGGHEGSPVVAFVGRLIGNKGPQTLLEALLQLGPPPRPSPRGGGRYQIAPTGGGGGQGLPFTAVYIGDGPMRAQLERDAMTLGTAVEFTGQLPDVSARLREAAIVVRPSLTEGLPLGILEAMASGVCVVASDIAGNRDLIRDGENGVLVPPKDATALAQALKGLLSDSSRRQVLAAAGLKTAQQYAWDSIASRTAAVLTAVADSNTGAAERLAA